LEAALALASDLNQNEVVLTSKSDRDSIAPSSALTRDQSRRRSARVPTNFEIRVGSGAATQVARCTSLSLGGMFVETALRFDYEAVVALELMDCEGGHILHLEAVVRWFGPRGFGVQFGPMGARETHILSGLIEQVRHSLV
jgi:type IV pilus assembly protein PilZ